MVNRGGVVQYQIVVRQQRTTHTALLHCQSLMHGPLNSDLLQLTHRYPVSPNVYGTPPFDQSKSNRWSFKFTWRSSTCVLFAPVTLASVIAQIIRAGIALNSQSSPSLSTQQKLLPWRLSRNVCDVKRMLPTVQKQ